MVDAATPPLTALPPALEDPDPVHPATAPIDIKTREIVDILALEGKCIATALNAGALDDYAHTRCSSAVVSIRRLNFRKSPVNRLRLASIGRADLV